MCFGWKECLTLNNKTRNNVAKWEIKGRSVKHATPDNFYCRLYGRFILINTLYRSEFWQVTYELHFTSIQIRNVWGCASWQFVSTSFFAQTFAKELGLAKSSRSPRILIAPIKLLMHKINLRHFFKCFKCLERFCEDFLKMCWPIFLKNSFISALGKCFSELVLQLRSLLLQNANLLYFSFVYLFCFAFK